MKHSIDCLPCLIWQAVVGFKTHIRRRNAARTFEGDNEGNAGFQIRCQCSFYRPKSRKSW
jgi:hypothetical protein